MNKMYNNNFSHLAAPYQWPHMDPPPREIVNQVSLLQDTIDELGDSNSSSDLLDRLNECASFIGIVPWPP